MKESMGQNRMNKGELHHQSILSLNLQCVSYKQHYCSSLTESWGSSTAKWMIVLPWRVVVQMKSKVIIIIMWQFSKLFICIISFNPYKLLLYTRSKVMERLGNLPLVCKAIKVKNKFKQCWSESMITTTHVQGRAEATPIFN